MIDGIRCFADGLPGCEDQKNVQAREDTLRGAWACGAVLGKVGMALHHKLCHALGGSLPHAETHAIILPHAIAFNEVIAKAELAPVRRYLATRGLALHFGHCETLGAHAIGDIGY